MDSVVLVKIAIHTVSVVLVSGVVMTKTIMERKTKYLLMACPATIGSSVVSGGLEPSSLRQVIRK